jgi:hypothetical protein
MLNACFLAKLGWENGIHAVAARVATAACRRRQACTRYSDTQPTQALSYDSHTGQASEGRRTTRLSECCLQFI